jgi:hypothetical protein
VENAAKKQVVFWLHFYLEATPLFDQIRPKQADL